MTQSKWTAFPYPDKAYAYAGAALEKNWPRLHAGDREPFPSLGYVEAQYAAHSGLKPAGDAQTCAESLQEAWRAYHRGDFGHAIEEGLAIGPLGTNVANKASNIYATYLAPNADDALALYQETCHRAEQLQALAPRLANAWYLHGQAMGRYSQGISIAVAMTQGLAGKVKVSLDRAIHLEPHHADAEIALGAYHAEIIGKVGSLIGGLTYGASKDAAIGHFEKALRLNPESAIARIEYAGALAQMFGRARAAEARRLYEAAAACKPADAMEHFDVELAKARATGR